MIILPPIGQAWVSFRDDATNKLVESHAFQAIYRVMADLVSQQTLDGDGTPEGVLTAPYRAQYWDFTSQKLYFKSTPDGNTGWVAIN